MESPAEMPPSPVTDAVLERVVEQAAELLHVSRVGLAVIEPDAKLDENLDVADVALRFVATRGMSAQFPQIMRPLHWRDGTTPTAISERRPVWSEDVLNDPAIDLTPATRRNIQAEGYHAVLSVPLLSSGRVLGALVLYRDQPGPFTPEVVELAQVFAAQAAVAIENARLYRRAEDRATKLHALSALTQLIVTAATSGEVSLAVAKASTQLLGARVARVWVDAPGLGVLRVEAAHVADPTTVDAFTIGAEMANDEGVAGAAFTGRRPLYGRDLQADPQRSERLAAHDPELHAYAALPLVTAERVVGVLIVLFAERRDFTAEEQDLMRLAGVAHDFNNMLAVILGRTELLLTRTGDPALRRSLEDVHRAAVDGSATVRRIQNFTGTRRSRPPGRVALGEVVREVVQLTRVRWKDEAQRTGVQYEVGGEGDAPAVVGHADELREVFTNLLNNALEAMPSGGRCTFRLATQGQTATVEIEDTGVGMPPEVCARIFEPFFTTKGPQGGGLGLAVTWGIVSSCGGTIAADSTPGHGTRLTVSLPIPDALPDEAPGAAAPSASAAARVLVIDDEESVRDVLADMLMEAGHVVTQAGSGAEALGLCAGEPFDLVITDLSMPGMSGWEVAAAVESKYPSMAVGIVTGWGEQVDPDQAARHRLKFVLAKPFRLLDVTSAVSAVLDSRAAQKYAADSRSI